MPIFDRTDPRSIDRRQWELWMLALTVVFVLAVGTALLMYSTAISNDLIVRATTKLKIFVGFCALSVLLAGYLLERQVATSQLSKRLAEERKRTGEALRQLSGRLIHMQDQERRRIARELHDATAQSLAALAINLNVVKDSAPDLSPKARTCLSESFGLAEQCSREIRTLSYLMHPPLLDEAGLDSALRGFVDGYAQRTGIHVDLEMSPTPTRLPGDIELALYRIVQEGLTNIHLHSGSKRAHICLRFRPDQAVLTVADEGHGIPPGVLERGWRRDAKRGIGISGMRERIRQLGGQFEILTGTNGTTLTAIVMLREGQA